MKENRLVNLIDTIVGPTLDQLGSRATNETWLAPNVSQSMLVDKTTGEVVGQNLTALRDGIASIDTFDRPTTLRAKTKTWLEQKLQTSI